MSPSSDSLHVRLRRLVPADEAGRAWWGWLTSAVDIGWIDEEQITEMVAEIRAGRDVGIEQIAFEHIDGGMRVSFLDDEVHTESTIVIQALASLLDDPGSG